MMNMKKIWAVLLALCLILPIFSMEAHAASGSISIGSASGNVGKTVIVKCTVKCGSGPIGTADVVLKYDASGLEYVGGSGGYSLTGGSGSVSYSGLTSTGTEKSLSFSMKFKIKKEGTFKISTSSMTVYNLDEELLSMSGGSGKITGKAVSTNNNEGGSTNNNQGSTNNNEGGNNNQTTTKKDSNCQLKSLEVYPGTVSPAFSANTTSYKVEVPGDVTEVTITAEAKSSKAKVSVSGGKNLKLGENKAKVVVTAEDDSTKVYNITIVCGEVEKIRVDGTDYTIYEGFKDETIPKGFERTKLTYNNREYEGLRNANGSILLMGLQNGDTKKFFVYNQAGRTFTPFVQVKITEDKYVYPITADETDVAFLECEKGMIQIQEKQLEAWKLNEEFYVVSVLNMDGTKSYYQYDTVEGTFQRYVEMKEEVVPEEPVEDEPREEGFPTVYYIYVIIVLGALVVILLVALIYFIATRRVRHIARKKKAEKKSAVPEVPTVEKTETTEEQ